MAQEDASFPGPQKNKMEFFIWRLHQKRGEEEHALSKQDILDTPAR